MLPQGPVQTLHGPGGKLYAHEDLTHWENGLAEERYHVFEPAKPAAKTARFVVFLHDWLATDPDNYMGWIRHLTRQGWVVLFPRYQGQGEVEKTWLFHAIRSVKDYQQKAFAKDSPKINQQKFAIIGHGAGAVLAANMAATSRYFGLPDPAALFILMPHKRTLNFQNLSGIQPETKMIILTGDKVSVHNELTARNIFYNANRVPTSNKMHLTVLSDYQGQPPLIADEYAPLSPERPIYERILVKRRYEFINSFKNRAAARWLRTRHIDAFDWYACFRVFDALADSAYNQPTELEVLRDNPELRFMGYWSDGKRLKGLIPTNRP